MTENNNVGQVEEDVVQPVDGASAGRDRRRIFGGLRDKVMNPSFRIVKHARWYATAPIAIILVGVIVICFFNLNLGLDFTGGRIIKVTGFDAGEYTQCQSVVREELVSAGINISKAHFQREDSTSGGVALTVKFPDPKGKSDTELEQLFKDVKTAIEGQMAGARVEETDTISASASSEKMLSVFIAVTVALIAIMVYMVFRFKLTSGIAATIALFHDVLIMISLVAVFRVQVNFVFVAAVITIIGYSLNNTLVLFDRLRDKEKIPSNNHQTPEMLMDESIKETLGRTLGTTVTTLVPVLILAIFGVSGIREFAIPILFGLLAGTYSSIFLASSLYVRFENAKIHKGKSKKNASH